LLLLFLHNTTDVTSALVAEAAGNAAAAAEADMAQQVRVDHVLLCSAATSW
jgi:hypothetical protein